jgi:hypothetical protein
MNMRLNLLFSILIVFLSIPIGLSEETPFDIMNTAFYANVTLKHLGTQFASRIEASLDPFDISPINPIGSGRLQISKAEEAQETTYFGVVTQLDEIKLNFDFHVDPGAEEKTYSIPLVLNWGTRSTQTLLLGIQVKKRDADFQVTHSAPEVLISGEKSSLKINMKNFGDNYALDLKVDIDSDDASPIDPIGQTRLVFEDQKIFPGEDIALEYLINIKQNTPEKVYNVPIALEWDDDTSVSKNQTLAIGFLVKEPHTSLEVSYEAPDIITPGDEFNVDLTIKNTGDTVYHIDTIVGERESLLSKSPDNIHIEELSSGSTKMIAMNFISNKDLATGLYSIPITLKYEGLDGKPKEQTEKVPIEVKGLAKLNIASLKIEPQNPKKGEELTIEARVENVGDDDAENTKLVLDSELEGFKTAYLGELEKDDDSPAIFTLKATVEGEVANKLILTYEDDFGEHQISEDVSFSVSNNQRQSYGSLLIAALIALSLILYLVSRKRKG